MRRVVVGVLALMLAGYLWAATPHIAAWLNATRYVAEGSFNLRVHYLGWCRLAYEDGEPNVYCYPYRPNTNPYFPYPSP